MGNKESRGDIVYSEEPVDKAAFTDRFNATYTKTAGTYDGCVKICPLWKNWLRAVLPYIEGPRVLEVSFGTGYLLTQYADKYETHGVEWNEKLLSIAKRNLQQSGICSDNVKLVRGKVEDLPYPDGYFDSVVITMAFTGYPDSQRAMSELRRVLKMKGRLIMVDVNYPLSRNCVGMRLTKMCEAAGDIIRDMDELFEEFGFDFTNDEIGCFGSVHLYVATKTAMPLNSK